MRSDLDIIRERHVRREVREEMAEGEWGWAETFRPSAGKPTRLVTEEELADLVGVRPGTPDGGY